MTVDRIFKTIIAYAAIYLTFDILLYLVDPGWQLITLSIAAALAILVTFWWGVSQRPDGPSYPSTVRARIKQGFRDGATKKS